MSRSICASCTPKTWRQVEEFHGASPSALLGQVRATRIAEVAVELQFAEAMDQSPQLGHLARSLG
jgi:hypothetical protein